MGGPRLNLVCGEKDCASLFFAMTWNRREHPLCHCVANAEYTTDTKPTCDNVFRDFDNVGRQAECRRVVIFILREDKKEGTKQQSEKHVSGESALDWSTLQTK